MIPKQAIEKAMEGGWLIGGLITDASKLDAESWKSIDAYLARERCWEEFALDRTFWQALGKALGWSFVTCKHKGECLDGASGLHCSEWEENNCDDQEKWLYKAHDFYDLILTGQTTGQFWADLLK